MSNADNPLTSHDQALCSRDQQVALGVQLQFPSDILRVLDQQALHMENEDMTDLFNKLHQEQDISYFLDLSFGDKGCKSATLTIPTDTTQDPAIQPLRISYYLRCPIIQPQGRDARETLVYDYLNELPTSPDSFTNPVSANRIAMIDIPGPSPFTSAEIVYDPLLAAACFAQLFIRYDSFQIFGYNDTEVQSMLIKFGLNDPTLRVCYRNSRPDSITKLVPNDLSKLGLVNFTANSRNSGVLTFPNDQVSYRLTLSPKMIPDYPILMCSLDDHKPITESHAAIESQ